MSAQWLIGRHKLNAVFRDVRHPFNSTGEAFAIQLDSKLILFIEDSNDGYRSCLGEIFVAEQADYWFNNRVDIEREVLVSLRDKGEFGGVDEVYEFRDAETGRLGVEVGTSNVDDYYPSFVVHYHAEAWGTR